MAAYNPSDLPPELHTHIISFLSPFECVHYRFVHKESRKAVDQYLSKWKHEFCSLPARTQKWIKQTDGILPIPELPQAAENLRLVYEFVAKILEYAQKHDDFWLDILPDVFDDSVKSKLRRASYQGRRLLQAFFRKSVYFETLLDLWKANVKGSRALEAASTTGCEEIVQQLLRAGVRDHLDFALIRASGAGYKNITQLLLKENPKLDTKIPGLGTALHHASAAGNKEIVQLLINAGANVDEQDADYRTPLEVATAEGHPQIVQLILGAKRDDNKDCSDLGNSLVMASFTSNKQILQLLFSANQAWQSDKSENLLALCVASARADKEAVKALLKAYDFTNDPDLGEAFYAATIAGKAEIVQLLGEVAQSPDLDLNKATNLALAYDREDIICLLRKTGANMDVGPSEPYTALILASLDGNMSQVKLLYDTGGDRWNHDEYDVIIGLSAAWCRELSEPLQFWREQAATTAHRAVQQLASRIAKVRSVQDLETMRAGLV